MYVSLLRAVPGYPLGKPFFLGKEGQLVAGETRPPSVACGSVVEFESAADLGRFVDEFGHQPWCLLYSVPAASAIQDFIMVPSDMERDKLALARARAEASPADLAVVTRTKSRLRYRPGRDGHVLFPVDYDVGPVRLSEEEVLDQLASAFPGFRHAPVTVADSASSFICVDGEIKRGPGGLRLIFDAVAGEDFDPEEGPRKTATLIHDRLVLRGHFWPMITENGALKFKTVLDLALFNMTQPDFLGGIEMGDARITRQRPACRIRNEGNAPFHLDDIKPLSPGERAMLGHIKSETRRSLAEEMAAARSRWVDRNVEQALKCPKNTKGKDALHARFTQMARHEEAGSLLPLDLPIHFDDIGWRTGHEIATNPQAWHGRTCSAPLEPYYRSSDGRPSRYKAKLIVDGTDIVIIDFSHGLNIRRVFAGETIFTKWLNDLDKAHAQIEDDGAIETESEKPLALADAPRAGVFDVLPEPIPQMPAEQYAEEAKAALARRAVTAVSGLPFQRVAAEMWIEADRTDIYARDIRAAVRIKRWAKQHLGDETKIVIMPSRTSNHERLRAEYGEDLFEYWGEDGARQGLADVICHEQEKTQALHAAGMISISSRSCVHLTRQGATLCRRINECGLMAREQSVSIPRITIGVASRAAADHNPAISGAGAPARPLLFDLAERPTTNQITTPISLWEDTPVLKLILPNVMAGVRPTRKPKGFRWLSKQFTQVDKIMVRPDTETALALKNLKDYQKGPIADYRRKCRAAYAKLHQPNMPDAMSAIGTPLQLMHAINQWFQGLAIIKVRGPYVDIFIHRPWTRMKGVPALIAASSVSQSMSTLSGLSTIPIGDPDTPSVARSGGCAMPSKVVQVGGSPIGSHLGYIEDKLNATRQMPANQVLKKKTFRDLSALLSLLVENIGPGAILAADPNAARVMLSTFRIEGCRVIGMDECDAALLLSEPLAPDIRWAFSLGYRRVNVQAVISRIVALPPHEWPSLLGDPSTYDGLIQVQSEYRMRDGTVLPPPEWAASSVRTRFGSLNPEIDAILMNLVAESLEYVGSALAHLETQDNKPRVLAIFSDHPMSIERANMEGTVLLDEHLRWDEVVPSAAYVWSRGSTISEAAARMGVTRPKASQDISEDDPQKVDFWLKLFDG